MDKITPRILLVEDDLSLAALYKSRLEMEGFAVRYCSDGEKALQALTDFQPDLVMLDLMMPHLDGFSVIDIMRNTPQTKGVKIIVLSAMSQPADQERAKALGADDFLVKSQVRLDDVMAVIHRHLNLPDKPQAGKNA